MTGASPVEMDQAQIEGLAETIAATNGAILRMRGFNKESASDPAFLDEACGRAQAVADAVFGTHFGAGPKERYRDIFEQVCDFAEKLAKDHIFYDGNKRTTVKVSMGLLVQQGIELDLSDDPDPERNELYKWIEGLVTGERDRESLAGFLESRAR